jgi:hypothetical protein
MKKIIIITLLLLSELSFSQKYELGKVTIEELNEKICQSDSSAVAKVLFNVGKTFFEYSYDDGFTIVTEITTKIKIYKKEGYDYANHSTSFYSPGGGRSEKVSYTKVASYNLVNGKIEKTRLGGDGEFEEKVNKSWSRKKITMPNVKEGSIIEYKIEIKSPYTSNFPEWVFQKNIPVNYSEYTTYIPEYLIYNTYFKGNLIPEKILDGKTRTVNYSYVQDANTILTKKLSTGRVNSSLEFTEKIVKYTLSNIPALKNEAFVNNVENYRATVIHELSGTRYPNSPVENFSTDWESVTAKIYENESFGDELKKTGYFEKDLDALLNGITSQDEKVVVVFNYVKSRMNWNEFFGIFCDDGLKKAYQDKKGSAAEINLMLTAMLRYAGIEANPILISTRSNGISIFPSRTSFNYVISGVELQNQVVLFDATNKFSLPNILPIRDLNWFGRTIRKNGSSAQINLMPTSNSKDIVNIMASINNEGEVSGKIREQYFDYNAFVYRENNNGIAKESYIEKLEKRHQGLEIGEYDVQNNADLSKPIVENYSFTTTNSVEIIGNKMYISPFLFFTMTENPFKQEKREYPVDFVYPNQDKFNISFTIPDGYSVETLPQPKAVTMPEELANFKYNISNTGNQVQVLFTFDVNQAIISSDYYEALKNFFKEIVNKQTEKIVLKKV